MLVVATMNAHWELAALLLNYGADPDAALMAFLSSTYAAAADAAQWDRNLLECGFGQPGVPRPA